MTVIIGASASFASPMAYQTNLMVMGPAGYTFGDYVKFGLPLVLLVGIVTTIVAPLVY
jgi:di/tricarboxylate transporter